MTFRAAAVVPPMVLLFPLIEMPPLRLGTAAAPVTSVPIRLPWTVLLLALLLNTRPVAFVVAVPFPDMTFPAPAAVPPIELQVELEVMPPVVLVAGAVLL